MGMGEPLLNYENVIEAVRTINSKEGLNLGARHISISTIGIIPGLKKLANEPLQINLAFSLHAPADILRDQIIPTNRKYNITGIMKALDLYIEKTNRKVMVEYLMIKGINDGEKEARQLVKLLSGRRLYYVNIIRYNKTKTHDPSPESSIERIIEILRSEKISVTRRYGFGEDIWAACGQLANRK